MTVPFSWNLFPLYSKPSRTVCLAHFCQSGPQVCPLLVKGQSSIITTGKGMAVGPISQLPFQRCRNVLNLLIHGDFLKIIIMHLTLRDPMDWSPPGSSVLCNLPEFVQIHVHWVSDTIQPYHLLPSPFSFASVFPSISYTSTYSHSFF